jgi:Rieske Fe-S protein
MLVVSGAGVACMCCANSFAENKSAAGHGVLVIGKVSDYAKPGYYDAFRDKKIMVNRLADRLIVSTAICTHKGCTVKIDTTAAHQLRCPCHKGIFNAQGTPIDGPPKQVLVRYAVSIDPAGLITVDTTQSFAESDWDKPQAFILIDE